MSLLYACDNYRNDLKMLELSGVDDYISRIQLDDTFCFKIYGDSAYCVQGYNNILARHSIEYISNRDVKQRCILENRVLSKCRQVIEWDYGEL